ncbi:hypothetical protein [Streptomyces sp. NBC_00696]|uniref:hypothetical protein n=1 Tax=Streptomyces sp. NBC_00696 TaxID=2903672 RepID=UPI002E2EDF3F|nr:hypothetical protein [Streptomyces sp. NBC_00696]
MRLMHSETGKVVMQRDVIHIVSGPLAGQAWRFQRIIPHPDGHKIHCTRSNPKLGRAHGQFPPHLFGCHIALDVSWYRDRARLLGWLSVFFRQVFLLVVGGVIAWLIAEYGNAQWGGVLAVFGVQAE